MADPSDAVDVLVVGAGTSGASLARRLAGEGLDVRVLEKEPGAEADLPDAVSHQPGTMAYDLLHSVSGRVAGLKSLDWDEGRAIHRARTVVLATGGLEGLYPEGPDLATGDGLVLASKAGAEVDLAVDWTDEGPVLERGVVVDEAGGTGLDGLHAAGRVAGGADPEAVAGAVAADLEGGPTVAPELGDYHLEPDIDSSLPEGFTSVKLDRLRDLMDRHLGAGGPRELDRAQQKLHRLKGEADAFDRARLDPELYSFGFACEVAVLILREALDEAK